MLFGSNHANKAILIDATSPRPHHKIKSYGAWAANTNIENTQFIGFKSNMTKCGAAQKIFKINPFASDYIPLHTFKFSTFENVHHDAISYLFDPPAGWNNPTDCVGFPCTAPSNVVLLFEKSSFKGSVMPKFSNLRDFQIVSDTPGASEAFKGCEFQEYWNAWQCNNKDLGLLTFIADDGDQEDRSVAPVYVTNEATGYTNKLNS